MSDTLSRRPGAPNAPVMDAEAVRAAYRRWAGIYDAVFGGVLLGARSHDVVLMTAVGYPAVSFTTAGRVSPMIAKLSWFSESVS